LIQSNSRRMTVYAMKKPCWSAGSELDFRQPLNLPLTKKLINNLITVNEEEVELPQLAS